MDFLKEIGKTIKNRRKELDLELEDIKDYSNITIATISNIENGKTNPTIKTLEKILSPLGLEITIKVKSN